MQFYQFGGNNTPKTHLRVKNKTRKKVKFGARVDKGKLHSHATHRDSTESALTITMHSAKQWCRVVLTSLGY